MRGDTPKKQVDANDLSGAFTGKAFGNEVNFEIDRLNSIWPIYECFNLNSQDVDRFG